MRNLSMSKKRFFRINGTAVLLALLSLLCSVLPAQADIIEDVFNKDRNLLAVTRYPNLADTDAAAQTILTNINSLTPTTNPVLALLASNILVASLDNIDAENWAETLYFSQPLEKNNDWVYIFHVKSPEKYIGALLGTGNIRQEQTEDNITRYRKTDGMDSQVYYLAYGENNLALISRNFAAVSKALALYQNENAAQHGIMPDDSADYSMILHLNRFFQANSRILPNLLSMMHYDILRDLAGTTAKTDNLLNLILDYLETSLKGLINEIAIIDLHANIKQDNIGVDTRMLIQYGGSLHYALSAYEPENTGFTSLIPDNSISLANISLWPEEYVQFLEGIGNLAGSLGSKAIDRDIIERSESIVTQFNQAAPLQIQQGVIAPDENNSRYGPVAVSVVKFRDDSVLSDLFTDIAGILTNGEYAEFLAEKGLKIEFRNDPLGQTDQNTAINEISLLLRSTYFTLPDVFLSRQYVIATIYNRHLITVTPLAPLTENQYQNTRDFCLQTLHSTINAVKNPQKSSNSLLLQTAEKSLRENTIFSLTFNPLRYLQTVMLAEAVWPTPSAPNRLPIPWREFSQYFNSRNADNPPLNITVNSDRTSLNMILTLPVSTLTALMQSLLNLTPNGEY